MAEYLPAQLERTPKPSVEPVTPAQKLHAPPAHPLLGLQARAGNRAIARMVQRESESEEEESIQAKHDAALQRESEEEEDEAVQAKHDAVQRKGEDDLQPRVGLEGGPVGADIEGRIDSMRGGGSSVPDGIRRQMESATGANLGGVRVHQDSESNTLNHQLTAKAFTTGQDIFLREDASTGDSELMAHELAHVVQQSSGRTSAGPSGMAAGAANDPLEAEADSLAHAVLSGTAQRHTEEAQV